MQDEEKKGTKVTYPLCCCMRSVLVDSVLVLRCISINRIHWSRYASGIHKKICAVTTLYAVHTEHHIQ